MIKYLVPVFVCIFSMAFFGTFWYFSGQRALTFTSGNTVESDTIKDNEPIPSDRIVGFIRNVTYTDKIQLYFEIFDPKTKIMNIVSLYGVEPWHTVNGIDRIKYFIEKYIPDGVIVISRINKEITQFDKVAIKVRYKDDTLIDLTELLVSQGLMKITRECSNPLWCCNIHEEQRYAQNHELGMWKK